jgi:hypothetical protein
LRRTEEGIFKKIFLRRKEEGICRRKDEGGWKELLRRIKLEYRCLLFL